MRVEPMLDALPFILFCLAFLVIGLLRAPRTGKPLPSVGEMGFKVLRIQAIGLAAVLLLAAFVSADVTVATLLVAQGVSVLTLLVYGLNVVLARR